MRHGLRVAVSLAAFLGLVSGCAPASSESTGSIAAEGGSVRFDRLTLSVPSGALDHAERITISSAEVDGSVLAYRLDPVGLHFAKDATVSITGVGGSASMFESVDGDLSRYEPLASHWTNGAIVANVSHLGIVYLVSSSDAAVGDAAGDALDGAASDAAMDGSADVDAGLVCVWRRRDSVTCDQLPPESDVPTVYYGNKYAPYDPKTWVFIKSQGISLYYSVNPIQLYRVQNVSDAWEESTGTAMAKVDGGVMAISVKAARFGSIQPPGSPCVLKYGSSYPPLIELTCVGDIPEPPPAL